MQGRFAGRLSYALIGYVEQHDLGEVYVSEPGFLLEPEPEPVVRSPDVAFVRKERIPPASQQEGFWPIAPDLTIEIISPSESAAEVQEKVRDYLRAGVRMVWLVYPKSCSVIEYRADGGVRQIGLDGMLEGADVLPGLSYPLAKLFR